MLLSIDSSLTVFRDDFFEFLFGRCGFSFFSLGGCILILKFEFEYLFYIFVIGKPTVKLTVVLLLSTAVAAPSYEYLGSSIKKVLSEQLRFDGGGLDFFLLILWSESKKNGRVQPNLEYLTCKSQSNIVRRH
jgi:hypothetical protein